MKYEIKRGSDVVATVAPTGTQTKGIMKQNIVSLSFELNSFFEFLVGDTIEVYGEKYVLNVVGSVKQESSIRWVYSQDFEALPYGINRNKYFSYDANNLLKEPDFDLTGTAYVFMELLLANILRTQSGWSIGDVEDGPTKTLSFSNENCLAVLSRLAEEFKTEYWIDGKVIHLTKKGDLLPISLSYGKNNGLRKIERVPLDENPPITRLYVFGSDKNIPSDYRDFSKRLKLPEVQAPDFYLEKNVDLYGIREEIYINEEIFPKRESVVSATDSIFSVKDASMNFDLNESIIAGLTAKITFNTGQLAGYTFDLKSYNNVTKEFIFNLNSDDKNFVVPNELIKAEIGDKFIIFNIKLPYQYIADAENELLIDGANYLEQNSGSRFNFVITTDPFYFERNETVLQIGKYITVISDKFNLDGQTRIVGYSRNVQNSYDYSTVEVSDFLQFSPIVLADSRMRDIIKNTEKSKKLSDRIGNLAYQNLVEKAKLGTTIMEGGYLKNELIETETLLARNIRTSPTGKRVEITQDGNNVSFYDADNKKAVDIDGDSAIDDGGFESELPLYDVNGNPTWISSRIVGVTLYYTYPKKRSGVKVGYGINDPDGLSTVASNRIFTTGKFSTYDGEFIKDGISKFCDFGSGKSILILNGIIIEQSGF